MNEEETRINIKKSIVLIAISFIIIIGLLMVFLGGDFGKLINVLKGANIWIILFAIGIYFLQIGIWTERWKTALDFQGFNLGFGGLYWVTHAGKCVTNLTPTMKSGGEPFRAYFVNKMHDLPYEAAFSTIIVEQAVGVPVHLAFMAGGLVCLAFMGPAAWSLIIIILGMSALSVAFLPLAYRLLNRRTGINRLKKIITWFSERLGLGDGEGSITDSVKKFYSSSTSTMQSKKVISLILITSAFIYLSVAFRHYLILAALGWPVRWYVPIISAGVPAIMGWIPFSPGGLIFVEGGMVTVLIALGVPAPIAVSMVIMERGITYVLGTFAGVGAASYLGVKMWKS